MSFFRRCATAITRLVARSDPRGGESEAVPPVDPAEEFQKIQRGLRRLSLASDRSGEILDAVAHRLDEIQQTLVRKDAPRQAALALEETELLRVLDRLDRAASVPDLPAAARSSLDGAKRMLLAGARWETVASLGAKPDGVDIRIAEFVGDASTNGAAQACIHRVLEQGYRRADGTLLRPGVVVAAAAAAAHDHRERT